MCKNSLRNNKKFKIYILWSMTCAELNLRNILVLELYLKDRVVIPYEIFQEK
jgi:hypothetical protein